MRRDQPSPLAAYVGRRAPGSSRTTASALASSVAALACEVLGIERVAAARFPWQLLRYSETSRLRDEIARRSTPGTGNQKLSVLRGLLRESWRLGLVSAEEYQRAADLAPVRGDALPRGREIRPHELYRLLEACRCDPDWRGARDAALLVLAYVAGLRRAELVAIDLGEVDIEELRLQVVGKGHRAREIFLAPWSAASLRSCLAVRGKKPGPFFAARSADRRHWRRLSPSAVVKICHRRGRAAGLAKRFTPHDLRRTCATHLLEAGVDLATVRAHLGHQLVQTTTRYDRRGGRALVAAVAKLAPPRGALHG